MFVVLFCLKHIRNTLSKVHNLPGDFTHELSWWAPGIIVGGLSDFRLHLCVVHHHIGAVQKKKTRFSIYTISASIKQ